MYTSNVNGKEIIYDDDHISYKDLVIKFKDISNILRVDGEQPGFVFNYQGKLLMIPCNPEDLDVLTPIFLDAKNKVFEPEPTIEAPKLAEQEQEAGNFSAMFNDEFTAPSETDPFGEFAVPDSELDNFTAKEEEVPKEKKSKKGLKIVLVMLLVAVAALTTIMFLNM